MPDNTVPPGKTAADELNLDGMHRSVVVIGGGQAGLSMSYCLAQRGTDHLVLEAGTVGRDWRERRWDTFCLVTPNWQCRLPGFGYAGADPHGFMLRDQVVTYIQDYAASFGAPLAQDSRATRLRARPGGGFQIETSRGALTADQVVVATGPYQVPVIPRAAERLPDAVTQLHSSQYRNPAQLPAGAVLVVGTGQSGCQIAEDLHLAGRPVHLATGSAPRVARFYRGKDVVDWLADMGYYDRGIDQFDDADAVRFRANHYVTGRDGGRDIDLRAFARDGMTLHGRLTGIHGDRLAFAGDLRQNLDRADAVSESIKDSIDAHIAARQIGAPASPRYCPVWEPPDGAADHGAEISLAAAGITAVIWATGFGRDDRWIEVPVFDGRGYPTHRRGVTSQEGLYFLGLPWLHTWGSGRLGGVGADAQHIADAIVAGPVREVRWLTGVPVRELPPDQEWTAIRAVG